MEVINPVRHSVTSHIIKCLAGFKKLFVTEIQQKMSNGVNQNFEGVKNSSFCFESLRERERERERDCS